MPRLIFPVEGLIERPGGVDVYSPPGKLAVGFPEKPLWQSVDEP
jgi:hypothetical protein